MASRSASFSSSVPPEIVRQPQPPPAYCRLIQPVLLGGTPSAKNLTPATRNHPGLSGGGVNAWRCSSTSQRLEVVGGLNTSSTVVRSEKSSRPARSDEALQESLARSTSLECVSTWTERRVGDRRDPFGMHEIPHAVQRLIEVQVCEGW